MNFKKKKIGEKNNEGQLQKCEMLFLIIIFIVNYVRHQHSDS